MLQNDNDGGHEEGYENTRETRYIEESNWLVDYTHRCNETGVKLVLNLHCSERLDILHYVEVYQ